MQNKNENLAMLLNELIETCKNAEKGFHEAAEDTTSAQMSFYLNEYGNQRGRFASVLQGQVRALGFTPDRKGTVVGALHRGWMNLRSTMRAKDEDIISECKRGDEVALRHYQHVLDTDLPPEVRSVIEYQHRKIKESSEHVRNMGHQTHCSCS